MIGTCWMSLGVSAYLKATRMGCGVEPVLTCLVLTCLVIRLTLMRKLLLLKSVGLLVVVIVLLNVMRLERTPVWWSPMLFRSRGGTKSMVASIVTSVSVVTYFWRT